MTDALACPTCTADLALLDRETFRCQEDHRYTVVGLALTTNLAALRALWLAIRALEDDATSLHYMAANYGDKYGLPAEARRAEAIAAEQAAALLRAHARRAQERLDTLPEAPSTFTEVGSQRGRSG